jgi:hypothetical protein
MGVNSCLVQIEPYVYPENQSFNKKIAASSVSSAGSKSGTEIDSAVAASNSRSTSDSVSLTKETQTVGAQ